MNLGVPPFDDIHVRKALNYAYDKAGGSQLSGGAAHRVRTRDTSSPTDSSTTS